MSASKLLIQKTDEAGFGFKSLYVTIEDGEDFSDCIKYSEWLDGKILEKKKDSDKSARLVVKIVAGNDLDKFNLESSAVEIKTANGSLLRSYESSIRNKPLNELFYRLGENVYETDYSKTQKSRNEDNTPTSQSNTYEALRENYNSFVKENNLNPFEHSLEKVKENNARIMENIHMLNRTLNYTKKKEILDVVCPKSMRPYPCKTCGKCFVYETGLRRHYSMRHAVTEIQPRWQVVWTCIQCFQVWPHPDQALKHSNECCKSDNINCVREIKTSSLLQCEFCEKVYTSIPRLLRHSKIHTTANNYECNACGMAFLSYKIAEQHWVSCSWLKANYSFSLPKLLLCNACDRKFRNYEQLYNHRYKVGHFMTKTHCTQGSFKSKGILVYQCELCSQWYTSITPLKVHKSQHHPRHDIGMQCRMDKTMIQAPNYFQTAEKEYYVNQREENIITHYEQ